MICLLARLDGTPVKSPDPGQYVVTYTRAREGSLWMAGNLGVLHYAHAGTVEKAPAPPLRDAALRNLRRSNRRRQSIAEDGAGVIRLPVRTLKPCKAGTEGSTRR